MGVGRREDVMGLFGFGSNKVVDRPGATKPETVDDRPHKTMAEAMDESFKAMQAQKKKWVLQMEMDREIARQRALVDVYSAITPTPNNRPAQEDKTRRLCKDCAHYLATLPLGGGVQIDTCTSDMLPVNLVTGQRTVECAYVMRGLPGDPGYGQPARKDSPNFGLCGLHARGFMPKDAPEPVQVIKQEFSE